MLGEYYKLQSMMVFDRPSRQRIVSARIRRSGENASLVVQSLSVGHLSVRLPGTAVLRAARLAQERSAAVAWTTPDSLDRHVGSLRELSLHFVHVSFRLHLAHRSVHH